MSEYVSVKEIAERWDIGVGRVSSLCKLGKLEGAIKSNGKWLIPNDVKRPIDKRVNNESIDSEPKFRFIDLFSGIGGFHQAMRFLGGECIMASEINQACVETYNFNFKTAEKGVRGDVKNIDPRTIGDFDLLCAGFPCQPFSKAGLQKGFSDETRGNLFYSIMNILDCHPECHFIFLENVRNLADKSENWEIIQTELKKRDFLTTKNPLILSPSDFGIPQTRERVYILGIKKGYCNESISNKGFIDSNDLNIDKYRKKCKLGDALSILEEDAPDDYCISEEQELMIKAWDEFRISTGITIIGYPIWINCFGVGKDDTEAFKMEIGYEDMPDWKKNYVNKNRAFYLQHRNFIDSWIRKYDMLNRIKLYQKFEWNCGTDVTSMKDAIIQVRQSGIRVKRTTYFPSLVAMVNTPIVWDKKKQRFRYIMPREAANLQSFDKRYKFLGTDKQIYRQLGNSVNVRVLKILCKNLFELSRKESEI